MLEGLLPAIIFAFASFAQSSSGFGFALVAVPLLLYFFDLSVVVPLVTAADLVACLAITALDVRSLRPRLIWPLLPGLTGGSLAGTYFLKWAPALLLKPVLGLGIILYCLFSLFRPPRRPLSPTPSAGIVAGGVAGVLGGLFGTNGPPIVMYLREVVRDKEAFRCHTSLTFLSDTLYRLVLYGVVGLLTPVVWSTLFRSSPGLILGLVAGSALHRRMPQRLFDRMVILLLAAGAGLILQGRTP